MKTKYKENDVRGNCICGHNHICYVEDLGKYYDEEGFDLILECCECDCENFKEMREWKTKCCIVRNVKCGEDS